MRADNSAHLIAAAQRRSAATRRRAAAALRRLDAAGRPLSFDAFAREAQVSRSWLYAQPDLRAEAGCGSAPWPARRRSMSLLVHGPYSRSSLPLMASTMNRASPASKSSWPKK